jgi:hypothetical protein
MAPLQRFVKFIAIISLVYLISGISQISRLNLLTAGEDAGSALAATTIDSNAFIPLVFQTYPLETVFGVEMGKITEENGLTQVTELRNTWIRLNGVLWSDVEATEGERDWSVLGGIEGQLMRASERDMQAILIVRKTPSWAQKVEGVLCGPIKEEKLDNFADFMYELVLRYSVPPYNVKYWEMGNEPDVDTELSKNFGMNTPFGCWGDASDEYYGGGYYAEMLRKVYPKIKEADPNAKVLVGGLLMNCNPETSCDSPEKLHAAQFLEGILRGGGGDYFDIVAFHNYEYYYIGSIGQFGSPDWNSTWDTTGPAGITKARYIKSLLSEFGLANKGLMNTETALVCGQWNDPPGSNGCQSGDDSLYEITKAYYIAQAYAAAIAEGLRANIWYSVLGWRNSGLLNQDLTPRLGYTAMQFSRNILLNSNFEGDVSSQDIGGAFNVRGYKFKWGNHHIWLLWSLDGGNYNITLSGEPIAVWDALGNRVEMNDPYALTITIKPVYLEWNP